eukprot:1251824-Amphidinium_carterae.1
MDRSSRLLLTTPGHTHLIQHNPISPPVWTCNEQSSCSRDHATTTRRTRATSAKNMCQYLLDSSWQ